MEKYTFQEVYNGITSRLLLKKWFTIDINNINGFNLDAHFRSEFQYDMYERKPMHEKFRVGYLEKYGHVYHFHCFFQYYFSYFCESSDIYYQIDLDNDPNYVTIKFDDSIPH